MCIQRRIPQKPNTTVKAFILPPHHLSTILTKGHTATVLQSCMLIHWRMCAGLSGLRFLCLQLLRKVVTFVELRVLL